MKSGEPIRRIDATAGTIPRPHFETTTAAVWARLEESARRESVDLRDLGESAAMFPEVRDAILRAANSVESGPVRPFDDVTRAMVFIGLRRLRMLFAERVQATSGSAALEGEFSRS